jgi:adenine deaminase
MTSAPLSQVTAALVRLKAAATAIGCQLSEPFLQLSFLALPVIPSLKVTDRGLVDVRKFAIVPLFQGSES